MNKRRRPLFDTMPKMKPAAALARLALCLAFVVAPAGAQSDEIVELKKETELGKSPDTRRSAALRLGVIYLFGDKSAEQDRDIGKALKWFHFSAELGDFLAQKRLADMYMNGFDVPRNYKEAYVWLSLYAVEVEHVYGISGHETENGWKFIKAAEEDLQKLEEKLSPDALIQAQDKAAKIFRSYVSTR